MTATSCSVSRIPIFIHFVAGVWPDDRNIAAFWVPVEEGDIIAVMSDGVHDNLDPQIQGLSPCDFDLQYTDWESMPASYTAELKKISLSLFT